MEPLFSPDPQTAELLESLTFIQQECLAAWGRSGKSPKDVPLLREARVCIQLKMKVLGIGVRKPQAALQPVVAPEPASAAEAVPVSAPSAEAEPPDTPAPQTGLEKFLAEVTPYQFRAVAAVERPGLLGRYGISAEAIRPYGYVL